MAMATGVNSDLLPVRKATKAQLARLKQEATYDEVVRALLELSPPDEIRARLRPAPPRSRPAAPRASDWREPDKQRLIASLARESWAAWRRSGKVSDRGPRAVAYFPSTPGSTVRRTRVTPVERRGLPP